MAVTPKQLNKVDVHVGKRLRALRLTADMTQKQLAHQLDVTFQQIQKYEKGVNRVSASRLYEIARIYSVSVEYFYDEMSDEGISGVRRDARDGTLFPTSAEGLQMNRAYARITDNQVRRRVLALVESL